MQGITVWLVGLNPGGLETVRSASLSRPFGAGRKLFNARTAIARCRTIAAEAPPP